MFEIPFFTGVIWGLIGLMVYIGTRPPDTTNWIQAHAKLLGFRWSMAAGGGALPSTTVSRPYRLEPTFPAARSLQTAVQPVLELIVDGERIHMLFTGPPPDSMLDDVGRNLSIKYHYCPKHHKSMRTAYGKLHSADGTIVSLEYRVVFTDERIVDALSKRRKRTVFWAFALPAILLISLGLAALFAFGVGYGL